MRLRLGRTVRDVSGKRPDEYEMRQQKKTSNVVVGRRKGVDEEEATDGLSDKIMLRRCSYLRKRTLTWPPIIDGCAELLLSLLVDMLARIREYDWDD
jgi:hypothetical protein